MEVITTRIGQITGTTDLDLVEHPKWTLLVDAEQWPLLTDTGRWGAVGMDLGANTEHEGRLYIFFGDVWPGKSGRPINSDLVAWVDEPEVLRHGGHLAQGLTFVLPFEPTSQQGQRGWRFCGKCGALFYDGHPTFKGVCHRGGVHEAIGLGFVVPAHETGAHSGQPKWRYCGKCASLFYDGYPGFKGVCPQGQSHQAIGWEFLMPYEPPGAPTGLQGQPEWRYCGKCAGLFWDGGAHKGLCRGAPGGGVRLNAVVRADGRFDQFTATDPVGETLSLETPNGAFSYAGKVWVFAGFGDAKYTKHSRPGDPIPGCYLTSKQRPDLPGLYTTEFLFSPRIGCCPRDAARDRLESHAPLGFKFLLSHGIPEGPNRQANYRFCVKCASLFWNGGGAGFSSRCYRGDSHEAAGLNYVLLHSVAEDAQQQANWHRCAKCASVFWDGGNPANGGLCPAGGLHQATPLNLVLAHPDNPGEDTHTQGGWRFCTKCHGAVFTGQEDLFSWVAPCVVQNARHPGLPQTPHQLGLVMFGFCYSSNPGIRVAWMPLKTPAAPMLQDICYYTGNAANPWSPLAEAAAVIFPHANTYTHLSAAWLEGPQRWILLYSHANEETGPAGFHGAVVARIGKTPWDWSDEIEIFNPIVQGAYGRYMHKVGSPYHINPDIPPSQDPAKPPHDGFAYGAFLLNRYTEWDAATRELGIYYLLSLSSPYQVQLMHSRLRSTQEWDLVGLPDNVIYGIQRDGKLLWYRHLGQSDGTFNWQGPNEVGTGWQPFTHVFSGGAGVIYAIQSDGKLLWYRHLGHGDGTFNWQGPNEVGSGWQPFTHVFSGGAGVIYAIQSDGKLLWYRHLGQNDGTFNWQGPNEVGTGWQQFTHVFSGGDGVDGGIYAIQSDGKLLWYRHLGQNDGTFNWQGPNDVGTGWQQFTHVFSGGDGVIYAIQSDGKLLWHRHLGQNWQGPNEVGTGWNLYVVS